MQVIILAAGKGTRMLPLTKDTPKPMLKIGDQNLLELKIERLPNEIYEIIFVIGYLGEKVKEYFKESYTDKKTGKVYKIKYVLHPELDGTGGAIRNCKNILKERFLVLMGDDIYTKSDLEELLRYENSALLMDLESKSGGKAIVDKESFVTGLREGLVQKELIEGEKLFTVCAAYAICKENFFSVPLVKIKEDEYGLPHTMFQESFLKQSKIKAVFATNWLQITDPESLQNAKVDF